MFPKWKYIEIFSLKKKDILLPVFANLKFCHGEDRFTVPKCKSRIIITEITVGNGVPSSFPVFRLSQIKQGTLWGSGSLSLSMLKKLFKFLCLVVGGQ